MSIDIYLFLSKMRQCSLYLALQFVVQMAAIAGFRSVVQQWWLRLWRSQCKVLLRSLSIEDGLLVFWVLVWISPVSCHQMVVNPLDQWFLTCGEFPIGGEWRSCQVGNDRSDSRTTASKFNTSHPNVDLLYKSQPFTDCFNNNQYMYMRYCKSFTH